MAKSSIKRERPDDGRMAWHVELHAFECLGCGEFEEIRTAALRTPEMLAQLKELAILDHTECWEFDDPRMARDARRYRKRGKLCELLGLRPAPDVGKRVSYPGRRAWLAGSQRS